MHVPIAALLARLASISANRVERLHISLDHEAEAHLHENHEIPLSRTEHGISKEVDETPLIQWSDLEQEIKTHLDAPGIRVFPWKAMEEEIRTQLDEPGMRVEPKRECPRPKALTKDGYTISHEGVVQEWFYMSRMMRTYLEDLSTPTLVEGDNGTISVVPPKKQLFTLGQEVEQARHVIDELCFACDDDTFESNGEVLECLQHMRRQFDTYIDTRLGMTVRDAAVVLLSFTVSSGAMVASVLFPPAAGLGIGAAFGFKAGVQAASIATTTAIEVGIGDKKLTAHVLVSKGTTLLYAVAATGLAKGLDANGLPALSEVVSDIGKRQVYPMARTLGFEKWLASTLLGPEEPDGEVANVVPLVRPLGGLLSILKRRPLHVLSARLQLTRWGEQVQYRVRSKTSRTGVSSLVSALLPASKLRLHIALFHQHQFDVPASVKDDGYEELVEAGYFKDLSFDAHLHMADPSFTLDSPDPSFFGGSIWLAVQLQWRTDLRVPVVANSCALTALHEDLRTNGEGPVHQLIHLYDEPYDTNCARIDEVQYPSGHRHIGELELVLQYAPA